VADGDLPPAAAHVPSPVRALRPSALTGFFGTLVLPERTNAEPTAAEESTPTDEESPEVEEFGEPVGAGGLGGDVLRDGGFGDVHARLGALEYALLGGGHVGDGQQEEGEDGEYDRAAHGCSRPGETLRGSYPHAE
jgi:hypothetical protein